MEKSTKIKNSFRNIFFGVIKYFIVIIFPFIIRTIIINNFGTEYSGIGSLFSSILQVLNLSELGFSSAIVYSLYKPIANKDYESIGKLLSLYKKIYKIIGLTILCIGFSLCLFLKYLIKGDYPQELNIYIIYIMYLINTSLTYLLFGYKSAIIIAYQRSDIESKIQIVSNSIMYFLQLIFLVFIKNYYLYTISIIIGTVINNILLNNISNKMFNNFNISGKLCNEEKKKIYRNVFALFGHQLDAVIINSTDNIIISSFLGLNILTIYNNYYMIISSVISLLIIISNSFSASIGNSVALESTEKNYNDFLIFSYILGLINICCTVLMLVLFQDFIKIWLGKEMILPMVTVILLVISFYVRQLRRALLTYKNATGKWQSDFFKPYVASIFNLAINLILVQFIGLNGVIISTIISLLIVETPWETYMLFKDYFKKSMRDYIIQQIVLFIKLIFLCIIIYILSIHIIVNNWIEFLIKSIFLTIIVIIFIAIICIKDKEFKNIFLYIKNTLKSLKVER